MDSPVHNDQIMMFVDYWICYKYYFQEFELKINPLTLKVTLNHRHNTIKGFTSQNPMKMS